jgi:hypothetical protein
VTADRRSTFGELNSSVKGDKGYMFFEGGVYTIAFDVARKDTPDL